VILGGRRGDLWCFCLRKRIGGGPKKKKGMKPKSSQTTTYGWLPKGKMGTPISRFQTPKGTPRPKKKKGNYVPNRSPQKRTKWSQGKKKRIPNFRKINLSREGTPKGGYLGKTVHPPPPQRSPNKKGFCFFFGVGETHLGAKSWLGEHAKQQANPQKTVPHPIPTTI